MGFRTRTCQKEGFGLTGTEALSICLKKLLVFFAKHGKQQ